MSAPVSTTVIALDVPAAPGNADAVVSASFERLISIARQLGFVSQDPGALSLAVTLAPEAAVGGALTRLATAMAEFDAQTMPVTVRGVVHYGVVFRSESGGKVSYMGSAIRSAQSTLKRAPTMPGLSATREFSAFAAGLPAMQLTLGAPADGAADSLSSIDFAGAAGKSGAVNKPGDQLPSTDVELVQFLKKRLAADLGPFASALVDNARRSASSSTQLVADLCREIDNAAARQRFEAEALAYVKSRFRSR